MPGAIKGFVEGGIASVVAGCSTHPIDLIKVRMQLQGEQIAAPAPAAQLNLAVHPAAAARYHSSVATTAAVRHPGPFAVGLRIVQTEGSRALFTGVSATVARQCLYSTTRMGLYEIMKQRWSKPAAEGGFPITKKVAAGLVAGAIGAAVGNPADVAMVRMQGDGRLPPAQRRNYTSVADAITRMARQEGVTSLWRGSSLTMQRAMVVTASQLATYDQAKERLLAGGMKDGMAAHVAASTTAGLVAAVTSNPIDVVKTRIMSSAPGAYKGALDCAVKTVAAEGPMALYKGFVPTVMRQGPFTVVLFVTLEQVRRVMQRFE